MTKWTIAPIWRGETVAILGGGPSLTKHQVEMIRVARFAEKLRCIAINNAYQLAPWADLLWFCDERWWHWHEKNEELKHFGGMIATLDVSRRVKDSRVKFVTSLGSDGGFNETPDAIYNGGNSGYQALHVAVHLGATRILLLGYDMRIVDRKTNWHEQHQVRASAEAYQRLFLPHFEKLREPLKRRDVEVLNCTPGSALKVWPHVSLGCALA